jgi:hypothetical protein
MSLSAEERRAVVEFRIEKAFRAYEQAKGVIGLKYWETIANSLLCKHLHKMAYVKSCIM